MNVYEIMNKHNNVGMISILCKILNFADICLTFQRQISLTMDYIEKRLPQSVRSLPTFVVCAIQAAWSLRVACVVKLPRPLMHVKGGVTKYCSGCSGCSVLLRPTEQ